MIHVHAVLEDQIVTATRGPRVWHCTLVDSFKGAVYNVELTDTQFGAMMALATAGDEWEGREAVRDGLYGIARPALANVPRDCNPVP